MKRTHIQNSEKIVKEKLNIEHNRKQSRKYY